MRKVGSFAVLGMLFVIIIIAVVFVSSKNSHKDEIEIRDKISASVSELNSNSDYIISSSIGISENQIYSLNIVHGDTHYVEYPVDEDGNYINVDFGTGREMGYALSEWSSGTDSYVFSDDLVYKFPQGYTRYINSRRTMFVDTLLDSAYDFEEDETIDSGLGEKFSCYKFRASSKCIKDIFGVSSYSLYKCIADDTDDENIRKLCNMYMEDLEFDYACSDPIVYVGIDVDGNLRYVSIEVGGAGMRVYLTSIVVALENSDIRNNPDVSEAVDFEVTLKSLADYVSNYDTYDDALDALYETGADVSGNIQ